MRSLLTDPSRVIVEKMEEGAAVVSPDGVVLFANPSLARLLGRELTSLAGARITDLAVAEDRAEVLHMLALPEGESRRAQIVLAAVDGPIRTRFVASRIAVDGDAVLCLITELRLEQPVAAPSPMDEQLPARVLDSLPVGIYITNPDGTSRYANAEAIRLSGLADLPSTVDEAIASLNLVEAGTGKPYPPDRLPLLRAMAGESAHVSDIEIRDEPDQVVPLEHWGTPLFRDDDSVECAIATIADITSRVRAERVMSGQAQMLDLAHDAVLVWSPRGRIMYWNGGAETMYGFTADEAVGSTVHTLLQTVWPVPLAEIMHKVHRDGRWEGELEQRRADGSRIIVESRWAPHVNLYGSLLGIMEINRDATARKAAEAALAQRAAELEAANRDIIRSNEDLEQFAYVASHDLSEPLRAIMLPLARLTQKYQGVLGPDADEYIGFAVDGCMRMQKMIDDLLRWSRVGRIEQTMGLVDCDEVVKDVIAQLAHAIEETGAIIDADGLPSVWAERSQVTQLFQNLIANSLKFVAPGVRPHVEVAAEPLADSWRFTVTDNGIGIAEKQRERVFGMFKRLHTREEYSGSGIGLAMAKKVVERYGGAIGIEDAPSGAGVRFWFTLPAGRPPE